MSWKTDLTNGRVVDDPLQPSVLNRPPARHDDTQIDVPSAAPSESSAASQPMITAPASAVPTNGRSFAARLPYGLVQPRRIPSWVLVALVAITSVISTRPTLVGTAATIAEGTPTAYLALLPIWVLMIALTTDRGHRHHDVSDSDIDRILATLIAALAIASSQLALGRLGAVSEFWNAHLVSVIAWVVAISILKFGSRSAARVGIAWGFLLICFPPFFLLAGQALGGSVLSYGALTALYGAVAMFLVLRDSVAKWLIAPAFFALACTGTFLLQHAAVAIAYLAPSATLTVLTFVLFVRAPDRHGEAEVPKHSLFSVGLVIALAALVGVLPHHRISHTPRADLIWVRADWARELSTTGTAAGNPQTFAWGPQVMGKRGSVVRYRLTSGSKVAFLDVFSTLEYGRLTTYCCGLWYATAPPPDVERAFISDSQGIRQTARMGNQYSPPEKAGDPAWQADHWLWRYQSGSDTVYQAVYLLASRDKNQPENVAIPSPPSIRTGIFTPIAALLQDRAALHTPTQYDSTSLDAIAGHIIGVAQIKAVK